MRSGLRLSSHWSDHLISILAANTMKASNYWQAEWHMWSDQANRFKIRLQEHFQDKLRFPQGRSENWFFTIGGFYTENMVATGKAPFDEVKVIYIGNGMSETSLLLKEITVCHKQIGYFEPPENKTLWTFQHLKSEIEALLIYAKTHETLTKLQEHFQGVLNFSMGNLFRGYITITGFFPKDRVEAALFDEVSVYMCKDTRMVGTFYYNDDPVLGREIGYDKDELHASTYEELRQEIEMLLDFATKAMDKWNKLNNFKRRKITNKAERETKL